MAANPPPAPPDSILQIFESNAHLIESMKPFDLEGKSLDQAVNSFAISAGATARCLDALKDYHPIIDLVVYPFKLVYSYELKRRENSKKILAVQLTMKEFMAVILELRHIPHADHKGKDGTSIAARLKDPLTIAGQHIKQCASDCDTYSKKHIFSRTFKAKGFEEKLMYWIATFDNHRKRLETMFAFHTSMGVDMANKKLDGVDDRLESIEKKMEQIFRKLDTPREREIIMFLDSHGGARACLQSPELFEQLVARSGESYASIAGGSSYSRTTPELPNTIRRALIKELSEDIGKIFARNYEAFEKRLEMQEERLTAAIASETEHIIQTITSGAHDRIKDPDLREIWKEMGWKASVKARHFVMGLHDYYSEVYSKVRSNSDPMTADLSSPLVSPNLQSMLSPGQAVVQYQPQMNDKWALAYINATYIQPILEAVDDDGTGVVSIKEVNVFTTSRPEGWSLPHWIAYWAVGWQASVTQYKNKIYDLVQTMFRTLEHVLPANRGIVDAYLAHNSFWRIELLLRSTQSIKTNIAYDPDLARLTESYANSEEERLKEKLEMISYELDSTTTVSLITGGGRIERYIFPIIYLLLRHHMKIVMVACKHVLDSREMTTHTRSFASLLYNIDYRIQNLESVFKQSHLDIQARLGNFAFGMFQLSHGNIKRAPKFNSFGTWAAEDESRAMNEKMVTLSMVKSQIADVPSIILKYGAQDGFPSTDYYNFEQSRSSRTTHMLQGTWTGYMCRMDMDLGKDVLHVIRISFRVGSDRKKLEGKGETYQNSFSFEGNVRRHKLGYAFDFTIDDEDGFQQKASGVIDSNKDVISMSWDDEFKKDNPEDAYYQSFELRRTPPTLVRYRYTPAQYLEDPVNARWTYALRAACHLAQEKLWSLRFYRSRVAERQRFVELNIRSIIVNMNFSPRQPLSEVESLELEQLIRQISPSEARFYQALSYFEIQKYPLHPCQCDGCQSSIIKTRILCIQCMADDLSDNIELCSSCIDKTPKKRGFSHDTSHPVMKVKEILHDIFLARYVEKALELVNQYRDDRHEESSMHARNHVPNGYLVSPLDGPENACSCCNRYLFSPYWACILCPRESYYVCTDCESQNRFIPTDSSHKANHPLVLLCDSKALSEQSSIEDRLTTLQQRFSDMEHRLAVGLRSLDTKVEDRMSNVEKRLSDMERRLTAFEANADRRSSVLENLLRQLLHQTNGAVSSGLITPDPEPTANEHPLTRRPHINGRAQTLPVMPASTSPQPTVSSATIQDAPKSRRPLPHPPFNRPSSRLSQS